MPTDIYIGDTPIEEAYLGDDPIQMDDNNVCRPCYGYTLRKQSFPVDIPPTWVSASNCYNNETFVIDANSAVTRVYAASENLAFGPNGVFGFAGLLSDGQGQNACKNAYGKEEYLPCDTVNFNNPSISTFNMVGYVPCGSTEFTQVLLAAGGSTGEVCIVSGSLVSVAQATGSLGPC